MQPAINYLNRDFTSLKSDLVNWAKTYHSDKIIFFNDANPDIMYLEMCAYVGDMLSYYIDKSFNENFRTTAQAAESLVRIANNLGFYNTGTVSSSVYVNISVRIPYVSTDGIITPDYKYLPIINAGARLKSNSGVFFEVPDVINFTSEQDRVVLPNLDGNNQVIDYTVTKEVFAKSGETKIQNFYVSENLHKPFLSFVLDDRDITEIVGIVVVPGNQTVAPADYDFIDYNNAYYQVRALTQSKAFFETNVNSSTIKQGEWVDIPKRFIVRRDVNNIVTITFGNQSTEDIPEAIYSPVTADEYFNNVHDDVNLGFLPPINSTVFIKYRVGGGLSTNVSEETITLITSKEFSLPDSSLDLTKLSKVRGSFKVNNLTAATGGRDIPSIEEIREISGQTFAAQDRGVTPEDIKAMIQMMPPKYGQPFRVSYDLFGPKVANMKDVENTVLELTNQLVNATTQANRLIIANQIESYFRNYQIDQTTTDILTLDPNLWLGEKGILYILSRNEDGYLTTKQKNANGIWVSPNQLLKENIKNYLIDKRVIGDWIDIVDGDIYNIQVEFTIFADSNNQQQILIDCLKRLQEYFDVKNWQMNQPIYLSNITTVLQEVSGVINVAELKIYNIIGLGEDNTDPATRRVYQPIEIGLYPDIIPTPIKGHRNKYEMVSTNNIIKGYPNGIFEVKYLESDIIGKIYG